MLSLFADCLLVASRLPARDARLRAMLLDHKREDEEWLRARRAGRFNATMP